jgi:hypothetical protein
MTKTPKEFAQELVEKYLNLPIHFPYIDSEDGQCIGSGYMTWKSAKESAKIAVQEILTMLWHTHKNEEEYRYFKDVESEIEQLIN